MVNSYHNHYVRNNTICQRFKRYDRESVLVQTIKQWREIANKMTLVYQNARNSNTKTTNSRGVDDGVLRWGSIQDWNRLGEGVNEAAGNISDEDWFVRASARQFYLSLGGSNFVKGNSEPETLENLLNNRAQVIALMAYMKAITDDTRNYQGLGSNEVYACSSVYPESLKMNINFEGYVEDEKIAEKAIENHSAFVFFKIMQETVIDKEDLVWAISAYNQRVKELTNYIHNTKKQNSTGLEQVFESKPTPAANLIHEQLAELEDKIGNGLTARTYGFEIEVPDCKGVEATSGFEKGEDGSLRSYESGDDCDCDCEDCTYHDCDCDWCDNRNSDPDHCGNNACSSAEGAEYRTIGGVQRMKHGGMYELCEKLNAEDAEMNDSAGTHIHVFAADLTTNQVGQVFAAYKWIENILEPIAGRRNTNYAMDLPVSYIGSAIRRVNPKLTPDKPRSVNATPLFTTRGTIEFRQMDCNLNADRINAWAWIVRGLVTVAKRGATIANYKQVTDLNDLVKLFAEFKVEPDNEHPELIIYGSKSDDDRVKRTVHVNTRN